MYRDRGRQKEKESKGTSERETKRESTVFVLECQTSEVSPIFDSGTTQSSELH